MTIAEHAHYHLPSAVRAEKWNQHERRSGSRYTMSALLFKFTTSPKVDEMKRKVIPKNTDKCTQWASKAFNDYCAFGMFDVSVSY